MSKLFNIEVFIYLPGKFLGIYIINLIQSKMDFFTQ